MASLASLYRESNVKYRGCGNLSDHIMNDTFLMGVYPGLSEDMVAYIIDKIDGFIEKKGEAR